MPLKAKTFNQANRQPEARGTAASRGYDYAWQKLSLSYRRRHPLCIFCQRATELVDHIVPVAQGGAVLDEDNLRPSCRHCHRILTENLKRTGRNEMPSRKPHE